MRKAIVTGATGFIGSWLVQELLENDYFVTVVVRDKTRLLSDFEKNCEVIQKDISAITSKDLGSCNVFFHLAWSGVASDKKNALDIQLENIRGSLNVLESASEAGCGVFIATGTVAEYALCDDVMDMTERQTPNDFYGAAKVSAHYFMEVRARQLRQPFIWSVVPSTFGERRSDSIIVTYTIKALLAGEKPSYVDLNQMWDFLYVKDVVKALRLIGEKGIPDKVYGIGSGEYKTLRDYITRIRDVITPNLLLGIGEDVKQNEKSFSSCVNNYELKKDTGFQPEYSFEEGIQRTIQFYRKQKT